MLFRAWILYSLVAFVLLHNADAAITAWSTPSITGKNVTGTLSVPENKATSTSIETYVATGSGSITYSLVSAVVPFALSTNGVLTITASLDAENISSYTLIIQAVETGTPTEIGFATINVTVTDVNEAPVFGQTSYTKRIANGSPAETPVITVSAIGPEKGEKLSYSIDSGNTKKDFKIESTSGEIKVNTGKTLNMTVTPTYTLIVKAVDDKSPQLTGSTTVSIIVTPDGTGSGGGGNGSGGDGNGSGGDGNGSGGDGNGSGGDGNGSGVDGNGSGGDGNGSGGDGNGGGATAAVNIMTVLLALFLTFYSLTSHLDY